MSDKDFQPYQAPPRPRISPTFAATLRMELGRRDFTRSERSQLAEILASMKGQAASAGFQSAPAKDGDSDEMRALKALRLDGVWAANCDVDARTALFTAEERDLLPRILLEACTDFRPRPGHERAVPTHVAEARRANADRFADLPPELTAMMGEARDRAIRAADAVDSLVVDFETRLGNLEASSQAQGEQLAAILAAVTAPRVPAAEPAVVARVEPAAEEAATPVAEERPSGRRR